MKKRISLFLALCLACTALAGCGSKETTSAPQTIEDVKAEAEEKAPEAEAENTFKDMKAGAYYTEAVQWAAQEEITTGTSEDKFSPNKNCSKAQIVTFLYRCLGEK